MIIAVKILLFISNARKCYLSIYLFNNINRKFPEGNIKVINMYFEEINSPQNRNAN